MQICVDGQIDIVWHLRAIAAKNMEPGIINIGFDNSVILPHQKNNQYYLLQLIKQDNFQNRDVKSNNSWGERWRNIPT